METELRRLSLRVLVTGGAGFVGSHIVDRLVDDGHDVLVVDDLSTGSEANLNPKADLARLDIGDQSLSELVSSFDPDLVSHCAARASVRLSADEPAHDAATNIMGGINVCQAAVGSTCSQLIYVNTGGALYGEPEYLPCDENHPIRPISPYGLSKWTLERYLEILLPERVTLKVLRLANVYGPRQDPNGEAGVVAIFGQRMLRGKGVKIFGDGEQTRDYVYAADVAEAHRLAQLSEEPLTVNIGSGTGLSVNRLFERLAQQTGYGLVPEYVDERPGDVKHIVLDISKARRELSWEPRTSLDDGLRRTLASLAEQGAAGD